MKKSADKRAALVDQLANHVLAHGLAASTLRPLADAVGLSDRMLLYYFTDKADLMTATLGALAERLVAELQEASARPAPPDALLGRLVKAVLSPHLWPYMQLWLEIASLAARNDAFYRAVGESVARGFLSWVRAQIRGDDVDAQAARLLVMVEGAVVMHSVGLHDVAATAITASRGSSRGSS
jgi:AcrR family transcriptional regulator